MAKQAKKKIEIRKLRELSTVVKFGDWEDLEISFDMLANSDLLAFNCMDAKHFRSEDGRELVEILNRTLKKWNLAEPITPETLEGIPPFLLLAMLGDMSTATEKAKN